MGRRREPGRRARRSERPASDDEPPAAAAAGAALAALAVAESAEAVDEADDYVAMVRQRTSTADGPHSDRLSSASDAPPPPPPPQAAASSTAAATPRGKVIEADENGEEPWSPTLKGEVETAEAAKARAKAERRAMQRLKTLEEIIATERVYVERLNLTLKVYLTPLRLVADSPKGAIFSEELDAIFLNFETIKTVDAAQFGAILARNSLTSLHPAQVNSTFLDALEAEHEANWPAVRFAPILNKAAKSRGATVATEQLRQGRGNALEPPRRVSRQAALPRHPARPADARSTSARTSPSR